MKKRVKLAVIRDDDSTPCPFGLSPISEVCQSAGEIIDNMAPLNWSGKEASEEEKLEIKKANMYLLMWRGPGKPCKYAAKLFPGKQDKVDCSHGDTAAGVQESGALLGSPFYSQHFSGISLDGLYSFPLSFYSDYNVGRNIFYGIYSLQGSERVEEMRKLAQVFHEINTQMSEFSDEYKDYLRRFAENSANNLELLEEALGTSEELVQVKKIINDWKG